MQRGCRRHPPSKVLVVASVYYILVGAPICAVVEDTATLSFHRARSQIGPELILRSDTLNQVTRQAACHRVPPA